MAPIIVFYHSSLSWVLCRQDIQTILRAYLRAIGNKDAVLLYELNAEQSRDGQARNAYVLRWNHVLEDWCIFDFQILTCIENNKKEEDVTFFLTTYCEGKEQQVISLGCRVLTAIKILLFTVKILLSIFIANSLHFFFIFL